MATKPKDQGRPWYIPSSDTMDQLRAIDDLLARYYGEGGQEARETASPVLLRIVIGISSPISIWGEICAYAQDIHKAILPDQQVSFDTIVGDVSTYLDRLLRRIFEMSKGSIVNSEDIIDDLTLIEESCAAAITLFGNPRAFRRSGTADRIPALEFGFMATHLQQNFARISIGAASLRLALRAIIAGPDRKGDQGHAARVRRYRNRKRRRVAFTAQIDVYDDDLTLLNNFGFLTTAEKVDRDLVTKQIEAFLLYGFLTYPFSALPYGERIDRQLGRIGALAQESDKADNPNKIRSP